MKTCRAEGGGKWEGGLCRRLPLICRRLAITNSCNENIAPARHWPPLINWCNYCLLKLGLRRPGWSGVGPVGSVIRGGHRSSRPRDARPMWILNWPINYNYPLWWVWRFNGTLFGHNCSGLPRVNIRNQTLHSYISCVNVYWVLFSIYILCAGRSWTLWSPFVDFPWVEIDMGLSWSKSIYLYVFLKQKCLTKTRLYYRN